MASKSAIDFSEKNEGTEGKRIREFYYVPGENMQKMLNNRMLKREERLGEEDTLYTLPPHKLIEF